MDDTRASTTETTFIIPSPIPASLVFNITTKSGTRIQLTKMVWDSGSDIPDDQPVGIPIENGVEISMDYVRHVSISDWTEAGWLITITFTDGSILNSRLGWKQERFGVSINGESSLGGFESQLTDIETIEVKRAAGSHAIPQSPPSYGSVVATLFYTNGDQLQVTDLGFRVLCWGGSFVLGICCYGEAEVHYMPTVDGLRIDFSKVKAIEFLHTEKQGTRLPVNVTALDGQVSRFEIEPPDPCQEENWRLIGNVALGRLDVEVTSIEKIILGTP
jgi:hypothetical protein